MQLVRLHPGGGLGNLDRTGCAAVDTVARQIVGGGKAEAAVGNHANSDAERFGVRCAADPAVLGGQHAVAFVDDARLGQRCATHFCRLQRA